MRIQEWQKCPLLANVLKIASEVFRHEQYTETVDVYSFSMIFYYLLDGFPPWPTQNGLVAVRKAANDGERPPIPRGWDQRLQSLLQECWSENPAARPPFRQILKVVNEYASKSQDSKLFSSSNEKSSPMFRMSR